MNIKNCQQPAQQLSFLYEHRPKSEIGLASSLDPHESGSDSISKICPQSVPTVFKSVSDLCCLHNPKIKKELLSGKLQGTGGVPDPTGQCSDKLAKMAWDCSKLTLLSLSAAHLHEETLHLVCLRHGFLEVSQS